MPSVLAPQDLELPIVGAPLGGGPSTVALAAAYKTAAAVREDIAALRSETDRPFGVNVFVPAGAPAPAAAVEAYANRLCDAGVETGEPRWDDDDWDAKCA